LLERYREDQVDNVVVVAGEPRVVEDLDDFIFPVRIREVVERRFAFAVAEVRSREGAPFGKRDQRAAVERVGQEHVGERIPVGGEVFGQALDIPKRRPAVVVAAVARVDLLQFPVHEKVD
jgi:hypothetical protein